MVGGKNNLDLLYSFFVSSEDGLHLKFSRKEHFIAKFVYLVVVEVLLDKYGDSKNFQSDTTEVRKKLKNLQNLFDTTNKERIKMLDIFMKWTAVRKRNVTEMREVTDLIDSHKFKRKDSIFLGSSIGIIGGIFVLSSFLFPPSAAITPLLAIWGGITTIIGGLMNVVVHCAVIGKFLLANKIRRLKTSLREDFCHLKRLKRWFDRASLLKEATEEIMGPHFKKSLPSKPSSQVREYLKWNTRCFTVAMCDDKNNLVDSLGFDLAAIVITFCVMAILRDQQNLETLRLAYVSTQMKRVFTREFLPSFVETSIISLLLNEIMGELNVSESISYVELFTEQAKVLFNDWIFLNFIFNESIHGM